MKKILVASGKGGTGKTTISVAIGKMLKAKGYKVGIVDVDVDTPNLPEMMNIEDRELHLSDSGIIPIVVDGIELMSIGFIADVDLCIMWSGERRAMAISQMIDKVDWTCDVLIIDSPPGTSEELTTILKKFSPDGIVLVSTNHKACIADIKRTIAMMKITGSNKKILGIVKNMTYVLCVCGNKIPLFDDGKYDEVDSLTIDEIPYLTDSMKVEDYLENTISKIEEVI